MIEAIQLSQREQLIQRVLEMPVYQIEAVLAYIDHLEDVEDAAFATSYDGEGGVPLDEVLAENGFTREELVAEARAEGLIK